MSGRGETKTLPYQGLYSLWFSLCKCILLLISDGHGSFFSHSRQRSTSSETQGQIVEVREPGSPRVREVRVGNFFL